MAADERRREAPLATPCATTWKDSFRQRIGDKWPLLDSVAAAYSLDTGVETHVDDTLGNVTTVVVDYIPIRLATFRVCCVAGSIFASPILLFEQVLNTTIFALSAFLCWHFFEHKSAYDRHGNELKLSEWIHLQTPLMRDFTTIMTGLSTFLLSLYTVTMLARWWAIRTRGVGRVKASVMDLVTLIHQLVCDDEEVTRSIRRYARASLVMIVLWRRGLMPRMKEICMKKQLLTEQECDQLLKVQHNLHESIWAWVTDIVVIMYEEKKIKSDTLLNHLLDRCHQGREAVQTIHTYLAVKVPMYYVHLLSVLVTLHNVTLVIIMGILFGASFRNGRIIICTQVFLRAQILPMLFKAILLINADLSDPFDGGMSDFPVAKYEMALEKDGLSFLACSNASPAWILERRKDREARAV